jgi:hypothetical protein
MGKGTRFTKAELEAIQEALVFRMAGEIETYGEPDEPTPGDYEAASARVARRLAAFRGRGKA